MKPKPDFEATPKPSHIAQLMGCTEEQASQSLLKTAKAIRGYIFKFTGHV
jgi:hypothetical protein